MENAAIFEEMKSLVKPVPEKPAPVSHNGKVMIGDVEVTIIHTPPDSWLSIRATGNPDGTGCVFRETVFDLPALADDVAELAEHVRLYRLGVEADAAGFKGTEAT